MALLKKEVDQEIKKIERLIKKIRKDAGRKLAGEIQLFIERETGKQIAIEVYVTYVFKGQDGKRKDGLEIVPNPGINRALAEKNLPSPVPIMSGRGISRALAEKLKRVYRKAGWEVDCENIKLHGGQPDQWALLFALGTNVFLPGGFLLRIF